jgi:protein phosphatase PTC7
LRIAFVSQQQLRSFNHPFQLGWTGTEVVNGEKTSFHQARDACTSSIHVRQGDLVIVATDGLFDNVDTDEICAICLDWEQQNGFIWGGDIVARDLAETLVERARANSLRSDLDSPFAILA